MFKMARNAPSATATTAIQVLSATGSSPAGASTRGCAGRAAASAARTALVDMLAPVRRAGDDDGVGLRVDGDLHRRARPQLAEERFVRRQDDLHRDALHDLGEIPG